MLNPNIEKGMPVLPHDFQDWLSDQKVIQRGDIDPKRWDVALLPGQGKVTRELVKILGVAPGYLSNTRDIALGLYGFDGRSEINAAYHKALQSKQYLEDPSSLFVNATSQGLGIEAFPSVDPIKINSLFFIWSAQGRFVDSRLMASNLYGEVSPLTVKNVNENSTKLNETFNFESAVVESADIAKVRYYRVRILDQVDMAKPPQANGLRSKGYQDWLAENDLVLRNPDFELVGKDQLVKENPLSRRQNEVLEELVKNSGYFVSTERIAHKFWGPKLPKNWRIRLIANLTDLRSKCVSRKDITSLESSAWAVGIEKSELIPDEFNGLYKLWVRDDYFVPVDQICANPDLFRKYGLTKIRRILGPHGYVVGSREGGDSLEYILTHRSELVQYKPEAA